MLLRNVVSQCCWISIRGVIEEKYVYSVVNTQINRKSKGHGKTVQATGLKNANWFKDPILSNGQCISLKLLCSKMKHFSLLEEIMLRGWSIYLFMFFGILEGDINTLFSFHKESCGQITVPNDKFILLAFEMETLEIFNWTVIFLKHNLFFTHIFNWHYI